MGTRALGSGFRRVWAASAISNLGDGVTLAALPLLAASLTRDPARFAGVVAVSRLPWLLFSLHAGVVVDRVDRRRLVGFVNLARGAMVAGLGVAVAAGWASVPLLYAVAFALGAGEVVVDIAAQALTPALVDREALERANGRLFATEIAANQFAGPPIGGALFALAAASPFLVDGASFAVAAALVLSLSAEAFRPRGPSSAESLPQARRTVRADIAEGLRWLWGHSVLRTLALLGTVMNAVWMAGFAVLGLYALEVLGTSEVGFGLLLTASGVGLAVGYLLAERTARVVGRGGGLVMAVLAQVVLGVVLWLAPPIPVAVAAFAMFGFGEAVWNVVAVSLRQSAVPDHLFGRVNSAYRFVQWGSMPVGAAAGGALASAFGLRAPWIAGVAVLAIALLPSLRPLSNRSVEAARAAAAAATPAGR